MTYEKQFWINFAEGRITVPEMLERAKRETALLDWMNSIVPEGTVTCIVHEVDTGKGYKDYIPEDVPFTAQIFISEQIRRKHGSNLGLYLNIHSCLSHMIADAFPDENIAIDQTLSKKFDFMLDACPESVDGPEVEQVIEDIFESIPADLSKTKRVKMFKDKIKEVFPTAGGKWPRWVQDSEWPLGSGGRPMRFIEQKRKNGKEYADMLYTHYIFEDVDTGERRVIDQFT